MNPLLEVKNLYLGYAEKTVLHGININCPQTGLWVFLGPSGGGKSSLLRTLSGNNENNPLFWIEGAILLNQQAISATQLRKNTALLPQKSRLYTGTVLINVLADISEAKEWSYTKQVEQAKQIFSQVDLWDEFEPLLDKTLPMLSMGQHRCILLARLVASNPLILFVDEPFRDIAINEEAKMVELLKFIAKTRLLILITHDKPKAKETSEMICFFSGEHLIETTPTQQFFIQPTTDLGKEFLATGSAWPSCAQKVIDKVPDYAKAFALPSDFHWILPKLLAGMQRPGLLCDTERDLEGLQHLQIKYLVSLTEQTFDPIILQQFNITGVHFPIIDMDIPECIETAVICKKIAAWIETKKPVVLHCKAGLGRTGTMLACVLVYQGINPLKAIEKIRIMNSGYIQTDAQFDFVSEFANFLETHET